MPMSRRFILLTGAAGVVIAGGGWALTRAPKKARAPWEEASKGFGDPRLDALAYAILAPNPHNMQPWRIRLDEDDLRLTVFCDEDRLLPETDPPNRQVTIGFGCFIEMLRMAAAEKGYRAEIAPFPEGEPQPNLDQRPIAHVTLVEDPSVEKDPLFAQALVRRTIRTPFDMQREVSQEAIDVVMNAARSEIQLKASTEPSFLENVRKLTVDAWETEWNTPHVRRESIIVTRIGKKAINENPYGIALSGPLMEALGASGMMSVEDMDTPGTTSFDQSMQFYNKACETAMAYVWSISENNSRLDQLEAGRVWIRTQLAATSEGLSFHPLSQALQEFPEMAPHYKAAHEMLGAQDGQTVQMLVRLGFAGNAPASPREALTSKIMTL